MDLPATPPTQPPKRRFRRALPLVLLVVAVAIAHSREYPAVPYVAMPAGSVVACDNFSIRSRWRDFVAMPSVSNLLEAVGTDVGELRSAPGWRILIPLTTGRNTVLALTPPSDGGGDPILWGASHAGWRRLVLLFMLKTRWIPGLGRLEVAPNGSRYLQLGSRRHPSDWKVGFSMRKNVLLAALSVDGDAVRELEARVDDGAAPARVFGGHEPWMERKQPLHRIWVLDDVLGSSPEFDILEMRRGRFVAQGSATPSGRLAAAISAATLSGRNAKGSSLDADGAFAILALPGSTAAAALKDLLAIGAPLRSGVDGEDALAYLSGAPCGGSLFGIKIPAVTVLCPGLVLSKDDVARAVARVAGGGRYPQVQTPVDEGRGVLVPIRWQKGNAVFKTYPEENGVVELDRRDHGLTFCTSTASFKAQRAAAAHDASPWREWLDAAVRSDAESRPVGFLWIDLTRLADETRQIVALSRVASMLGLVKLDGGDRTAIEAADRFLGTFDRPCHLALLLSRNAPDGSKAGVRIESFVLE